MIYTLKTNIEGFGSLSGDYAELCTIFDGFTLADFEDIYVDEMDIETKEAFKRYFARRCTEMI